MTQSGQGVGAALDAAPAAPTDLNALIRAGEWRRAEATARALGADPEVREALGALVSLQTALRDRRPPLARRALAEYRLALDAAGRVPELALLAAQVPPGALDAALGVLEGREKSADPAELAASLAPALALPLTRAEALNVLGILHTRLDETRDARTAFEGALGADPGHYRARTNLGSLDLEAGNLAAAEGHYREALRQSPDYDGAHHNLGVVLRRQGKLGASVASIRRGQQLGLRRSKDDTAAEMREQFATSARLRLVRLVVIALFVAVIVFALRGGF